MSTTVLLVDDHELIRQGLARAFERDDDMTVVGQAGSVTEALSAYADLQPDVVVTDLQLPDGHGLDVVRAVRASSDTTGLVVLTMHAGDDQIFAAMEAGASAFVGKDSRAAEVVSAARHAAVAPRTFLCAGLSAGRDAPCHGARAAQAVGPRGGGAGAAGRRPRHRRDRRPALPERVDGQDPHHAHLPEAGRRQPGPGAGDRHADRAASTTSPQRF